MENLWGKIADTVENYAVLAEQVGDHDLAEEYRTEASDYRQWEKGDTSQPIRKAGTSES